MNLKQTVSGALTAAAVFTSMGLLSSTAHAQQKDTYVETGASYDPWLRVEGFWGTDDSLGRADLFAPLSQSADSLLYLDLRGIYRDDETVEGNFGIGYRQLMGDYFWGLYGYYDVQESENDNTFHQVSGGVEVVSRHWEFRLNGYLPVSDEKEVDVLAIYPNTAYFQFEDDNTLTLVADADVWYETALYGGNAELGYTVYFSDYTEHSAMSGMDMRFLAGYFYFDDDDIPEELHGPMGRVELNWHNLGGMNGLILTVGAEGRDDDVRGTEGYLTAALTIPLGRIIGSEGPAPHGTIQNRMQMPVRREAILTEDFIAIEEREGVAYNFMTNNVIRYYSFFEEDGNGTGTFDDPAFIGDAIGIAEEDGLLIGVNDDLEFGNNGGAGFNLQDGQLVTDAADTDLPVMLGEIDGIFFNFNLAAGDLVPQGEIPSNAPEFFASGDNQTVFNLADNNYIDGQTFDAAGSSGYTPLVASDSTNGWISESIFNEIDDSAYGIYLDNADGDWDITNVLFTAMGEDVSGVEVDLTDGGDLDLYVTGSEFYMTASDAAGVDVWVTNGSNLVAEISGNHFEGDDQPDTTGVEIDAVGAGDIELLIEDNDSTFADMENGVMISVIDSDLLDVQMNFNVFDDLDGTPVGIYAENVADVDVYMFENEIFGVWDGDGILPNVGIDLDFINVVNVDVDLIQNDIDDIAGNGIDINVQRNALANDNVGLVDLYVYNNGLTDTLGIGINTIIDMNTHGSSTPAGEVTIYYLQNTVVTNNSDGDTFDHEVEDAFYFDITDVDVLDMTLTRNWANGAIFDGFDINVHGSDDVTLVMLETDSFNIDDNAIELFFEDIEFLDVDLLGTDLEHTNIFGVGGTGVDIVVNGAYRSEILIDYIDIDDVDEDGIDITVNDPDTVSIVEISHATITEFGQDYSYADGISVTHTDLGDNDGNDQAAVNIHDNTIIGDNNAPSNGDGIDVEITDMLYADVDILTNTITDVDRDAVQVEINDSLVGAVNVSYNTITGLWDGDGILPDNGVYVDLNEVDGVTAVIIDNTIDNVSQNGIYIDYDHSGGTVGIVSVAANLNEISDANQHGILFEYDASNGAPDGTLQANFNGNTIYSDLADGDTFDHIINDGIEIDIYDAELGTVNINDNDIDIVSDDAIDVYVADSGIVNILMDPNHIYGTGDDGIVVNGVDVEELNIQILGDELEYATIDSTEGDAIDIALEDVDGGSLTVQYVAITDTEDVSTDDGISIDLLNVATADDALYYVVLDNVTIDGIGNGGGDAGIEVHISDTLIGGNGSQIDFTMDEVTVTNIDGHGIGFDVEDTTALDVNATGVTIAGTTRYGFYINAIDDIFPDTQVMNFTFDDLTIEDTDWNMFDVTLLDDATLILDIDNSTFDNESGGDTDGLKIDVDSFFADLIVTINQTTFTNIEFDGIEIEEAAIGNPDMVLGVTNSTFDTIGDNAIEVDDGVILIEVNNDFIDIDGSNVDVD